MKYALKVQKIQNLVTQAYLLKLEDAKSLEISNFSHQSITLEMEKPPFSVGQMVSVLGKVELEEDVLVFEAVAKIVMSEALSETSSKSEFYLQQFEKSIWARFLEANAKAQARVDTLLKKIKGED